LALLVAPPFEDAVRTRVLGSGHLAWQLVARQ
jgi:hypothetical protein